MTSPMDSPRRRPKGDKRARTRAKILEAAAQLVWEKGYEHTTMQEVARRAGVSSGAIYGNFKDREAVLAELGPTYWPRVRVQVERGASFAEIMQAMAEALIAVLPERRRLVRSRLAGLAYAFANEALLARSRDNGARAHAAAVAWWRDIIDEDELPMPVETLVSVLAALLEGLSIQSALTPGLVPDDAIRAAFAALAAGPAGPAD